MFKNKLVYILIVTNLIAANEGVQTGNNLRGHFSNVKDNVSTPLTSNSNFRTVNGSKTFKANLTCNDTVSPFLEITYTGTSDITVSIKVDTDLNGSYDKSYSFSSISGVGTNGVVKCSPNTWTNCKYFLWSLSNNTLFLQETNLSNLGGAYCINASCSSISATQRVNILDTIGGAISSMYQASNANYLITKTINDGNKIVFYGQNYQNCQNHKGNVHQGTNLDTTTVVNNQSNDTNSTYYVFNKNVENQNKNKYDSEVNKTVAVKKSVSVNGNTDNYTFTYSGQQQNQDGTWSVKNGDAKINIDFLNPDIKYCEVKYLEENTMVFTDGSTHHSSTGDKQTWKTKILECTGTDYSVCPVNSGSGEIIKHPCGEIDNFAEATSILMAVEEASDDLTCSQ